MYLNQQLFWKAIKTSFSRQHFHPLHATYVTLFSSAFLGLHSFVSLVRKLESIPYSSYRQQRIIAPIYITGNPRSGTTFLHRLLCEDEQFTYTKLYHTIFPSISIYHLLDRLEKLAIFTNMLTSLEKKGFSGWENIHTTKLNEAEEDEQFFVFTMLSPVITLLFPFFNELEESGWVDRLPISTREKLMSHYLDCLQRHLYAIGRDKTLLIKNTTCTGRLQTMLDTIPDLRVIHLIRHPYQGIPSLLSMYNASWNSFVPQTRNNSDSNIALAKLYADYYRQRLQIFQKLRQKQPERVLDVRYEDLITNTREVIEQIYSQFDLPLTTETLTKFKTQIQAAQQGYKSKHKYSLEQFGLTQEMIYDFIPDVFTEYNFRR